MEDYKKKYENALEWIKDIYPTLEGAAKEDAEHYFPELRESEDERILKIIKKTLISYNRGIILGSLSARDIVDCLAWLEKQSGKKFPSLSESVDSNSIEYTRTDTFIEKACGWLNNLFTNDLPITETAREDLLNDFRSYMKGE